MRKASVVIAGAGIMGASAAWHLAARGWRDILILDRSQGPGEGSTGVATGGFRAQFETPVNIRLSLLSRRKLSLFQEEIGADPGYLPAGYLWLASTPEQMEVLRTARAVQHAEGLSEAREVGPEEVLRLNPALRPDGILGGAFCESDGFIRPRAMLNGYLAAALRLGAKVEWGVEIVGLERVAGGPITRVLTTRGDVAADRVVNAAGAWAAPLAALAGLKIPVAPLRRQIASTLPCDLLPESMPMTIFLKDGFHLRVRDRRVLLLWPTPGVPDRPFDAPVDEAWLEAVTGKARDRVPILERAVIDRQACRAGLYEMTPDRHALLGPAPGCSNLYLINGSSGHGVMHAPALGHLLAEILADGAATTLDVTALRPERFAEGRPNAGSDLL